MSLWDDARARAAQRFVLGKKDIELLERLVGDSDVREHEQQAFEEMLRGLVGGTYAHLTAKQRAWAQEVAVRVGAVGYENLVSSGRVPRGREVPTPEVLLRRPLKPPGATVTISVVGLDPGFASLGYSALVLEPRPHVVRFGVFRTQKIAKKQKVLTVEDNVRRAMDIARFLRQLACSSPRTVAICAEAMSFPRSSSVAAKVALAWGAIASLSEAAGIPVLQASPQQVKAAVCGVKSATKEEVQDAVYKLYPEIGSLRKGIVRGQWEHAHDSLAVAHLMLKSHLVQMLRPRGERSP